MAPTAASFTECASGSERVRDAKEPNAGAKRQCECIRFPDAFVTATFVTATSLFQPSALEYGHGTERLRERCPELRHG